MQFFILLFTNMGLQSTSIVKNQSANSGVMGSISGSGRSPGEGNSNSLPSVLAWETPCTEKPGGL